MIKPGDSSLCVSPILETQSERGHCGIRRRLVPREQKDTADRDCADEKADGREFGIRDVEPACGSSFLRGFVSLALILLYVGEDPVGLVARRFLGKRRGRFLGFASKKSEDLPAVLALGE